LGQAINTLKLTSPPPVSVPELFYVTGSLIQESFRPLEFYTTLALAYLALIVPLSAALQVLERRLSQRFEHG
jgi:polar amino acid transport system permease protein